MSGGAALNCKIPSLSSNIGAFLLTNLNNIIMSQTMPFTTEEQMTKVQKFFNEIDKPVCNCQRGVAMCKHTPCMGTVEDMEALMNAGYSKNLMLDSWAGSGTVESSIGKVMGKDPNPNAKERKTNPFTEDVIYLVPAIVGMEGTAAPFNKTGTCNLLVDDKCSVHDKGLKPIQGKFACCSLDRVFVNEHGRQEDIDERKAILMTWNTQKGRDLIERWKQEVNFTGEENNKDMPKSLPDLLKTLIDVLESHSRMRENAKNAGPLPVMKTLTYEKPY